MPIYLLSDEHPELFPPPERADKSGVLAVGGDLRPERLLAAYSRGIFPWYSEGDPILWHSPDPRFVLEPERLASSVKRFTSWGFQLIDCQVETEHLAR
ncbi:leucyl/phenylalanyl-tRNA--protein transferase, partial [Pyxidicoccus sp. 3LG]